MFTWKLWPLFVKRSVNFFPTCLLLTFCWKLDTKYARKIARSGDWCRLKGLFGVHRRDICHTSPKRWSRDLIPIMGGFPCDRCPWIIFQFYEIWSFPLSWGTGLVQLFFAKWLNSLEINDVWWCWTILYSIKTLSEYWWRWWMQMDQRWVNPVVTTLVWQNSPQRNRQHSQHSPHRQPLTRN